jgi:hypothetical protein
LLRYGVAHRSAAALPGLTQVLGGNMGFLDGLFGKKRDKGYDWLELHSQLPPKWQQISEDDDGLQYSIDRSSCFADDDVVWWKQRIGKPGWQYEYMICGGTTSNRSVIIPVLRTLTDPEQAMVKPDALKLRAIAEKSSPLGECLDKAKSYGWFNKFTYPPPYVLYAMSIAQEK